MQDKLSAYLSFFRGWISIYLLKQFPQKESNLQVVLRNLPDIEIHYTFSPQSITLVQTFILFHIWFL